MAVDHLVWTSGPGVCFSLPAFARPSLRFPVLCSWKASATSSPRTRVLWSWKPSATSSRRTCVPFARPSLGFPTAFFWGGDQATSADKNAEMKCSKGKESRRKDGPNPHPPTPEHAHTQTHTHTPETHAFFSRIERCVALVRKPRGRKARSPNAEARTDLGGGQRVLGG